MKNNNHLQSGLAMSSASNGQSTRPVVSDDVLDANFKQAINCESVEKVRSMIEQGLYPPLAFQSSGFLQKASLVDGPRGFAMVDLLIDSGMDVNGKGILGWTTLHWLCLEDRVDMARHLISRGADPTTANNENQTPLHRAMQVNAAKCLELFLDLGADPHAFDCYGRSLTGNTESAKMTDLYHSWVLKTSAKKALQEISQDNQAGRLQNGLS